VITELDPHLLRPYWDRRLILNVEPDLEKPWPYWTRASPTTPSLDLPTSRRECSYAKQYDRAVLYFRKAAAVPPRFRTSPRLVAGNVPEAGRGRDALAGWQRIAKATKDDKCAPHRREPVARARGDMDLAALRAAIDDYHLVTDWPRRLSQHVDEGYIRSCPDPGRRRYRYDPGRARRRGPAA